MVWPSFANKVGNLTRAAIEKGYFGSSFRAHQAAVAALWLAQQQKLGFGTLERPKKFDVSVDDYVPPLSWLCTIQDGAYNFTVGSKVELASDRVFEGVWDGDFASSDPSKCRFVYGSGAVLKRHVTFVPPKHGYEYLFVVRAKATGLTYVSNSLCFCLVTSGINEGSATFDLIDKTLNSTTNDATLAGIDRYDPMVCEDTLFSVHRMMYYNFCIGRNGKIRLTPSIPKEYFTDFKEYRNFISSTLQKIFENASSPEREHPLSPVTAISKGYDSPAVSVLAMENGCDLGLTLDVTVGGMSDSGADIARQLGLRTVAFNHVIADDMPRLRREFHDELKQKALEFIATPGVGDDVAFLPFEPELRDKVFLSGALGDSAWERSSSMKPGLPVRVIFGKSLTEFRLRVGFAHVPLPAIGARFPRSIIAISNSEDMKRFSIAGNYDRPIARRIVEEAGVAREAFGIAKNATAPLVMNYRSLFAEAFSHVMQRYRKATR